mmetsp:Transcript_38973/g.89823  ORF Transcript_38973/g.89823 Transcript_38973/m.89823 type:complete len:264 (+) Transcript_38973:68-859(+)
MCVCARTKAHAACTRTTDTRPPSPTSRFERTPRTQAGRALRWLPGSELPRELHVWIGEEVHKALVDALENPAIGLLLLPLLAVCTAASILVRCARIGAGSAMGSSSASHEAWSTLRTSVGQLVRFAVRGQRVLPGRVVIGHRDWACAISIVVVTARAISTAVTTAAATTADTAIVFEHFRPARRRGLHMCGNWADLVVFLGVQLHSQDDPRLQYISQPVRRRARPTPTRGHGAPPVLEVVCRTAPVRNSSRGIRAVEYPRHAV